MEVEKETFPKWPSRIHEKVFERDNFEHDVWIV